MPNKRGVKKKKRGVGGGGCVEIFVKFNKRGGDGISKYPLSSVVNEKRDINV